MPGIWVLAPEDRPECKEGGLALTWKRYALDRH